jgi:hypothetical protein
MPELRERSFAGHQASQRSGALREVVPVKGAPILEAATVVSMLAGVLVGLLIADSSFPAEELDVSILDAT